MDTNDKYDYTHVNTRCECGGQKRAAGAVTLTCPGSMMWFCESCENRGYWPLGGGEYSWMFFFETRRTAEDYDEKMKAGAKEARARRERTKHVLILGEL